MTGLTAPIVAIPPFVKTGIAFIFDVPLAAYISNLLIDPRSRRKGYAKMLIQHCEEYALSNLGSDKVYLHADADYFPATLLYDNIGYKILKEDRLNILWHEKLRQFRLRYYCKQLTNKRKEEKLITTNQV